MALLQNITEGEYMSFKILIAEDDTDIQEVLKLYLENAGYAVVSACNGKEAYSLLNVE